MKPKLFVGNLSFETTDEELKKLFSPYGEIESAVVIVDRRSGKSKGYGFVQMVESKDAARALEISGQEFMGRDIIVTEAESPGEGESRRKRKMNNGGRNRGGQDHGNRNSNNRRYGSKNESGTKPEKKSLWDKIVGIFAPKKEEPKSAPRPPRQNRSGRPRSGGGNRNNRSNRPNRSGGGQRRSFSS